MTQENNTLYLDSKCILYYIAIHSKKARIKYETKRITFDPKVVSNMSLPFPDQSDPKSRIKKLDPKWDQIFLSNDTETDQNNDP